MSSSSASSLLEALTTSLTGSPDATKVIASAILSKIPEKMLTMKYAYDYVFTTTIPILDVHRAVSPLFQHLFLAIYDCLRTICLLIFYFALIVAKLLILAFPHALKLGKVIYDFHRTQLTTMDIIIELLAITILLIVLVFRKRIVSWWMRVESYISAKSKAAAKAAPHVLFFTVSLFFAIVGKKFILPLTSPTLMPIFTLLIPLSTTVWKARKYQLMAALGDVPTTRTAGVSATDSADSSPQLHENDRKMMKLGESLLILWVILGIYHGVVTALSLIPFSNKLLSFLPYLKELVISILIWIQAYSVFADIVFVSVISPLMTTLATYIPTTTASRSIEEHTQQASAIFSALKMMRLINDNQIRIIRAILQDSVVSIMAILFVFLPFPFSTIGMVTISLVLPAFRSVAVTNMIRHRLHSQHRHGQDAADGRARGPRQSREHSQSRAGEVVLMSLSSQWINYWICIGFVWLFKLYVVDLWPSVTISASLWLQHSYFNGATTAIENTYSTFCVIMERNKSMQEERQRERQRRLEREQEEERQRQQAIGEQSIVSAADVEDRSETLQPQLSPNSREGINDLDEYVNVSPAPTGSEDSMENDIAQSLGISASESQRGTPIGDEGNAQIRRRGGGRSPVD